MAYVDFSPIQALNMQKAMQGQSSALDAGYLGTKAIDNLIQQAKQLSNKAKVEGTGGNNKQTKKGTGWFPGKFLAKGLGGLGRHLKGTYDTLKTGDAQIFADDYGLFQGGKQNRFLGRFKDAIEGAYGSPDQVTPVTPGPTSPTTDTPGYSEETEDIDYSSGQVGPSEAKPTTSINPILEAKIKEIRGGVTPEVGITTGKEYTDWLKKSIFPDYYKDLETIIEPHGLEALLTSSLMPSYGASKTQGFQDALAKIKSGQKVFEDLSSDELREYYGVPKATSESSPLMHAIEQGDIKPGEMVAGMPGLNIFAPYLNKLFDYSSAPEEAGGGAAGDAAKNFYGPGSDFPPINDPQFPGYDFQFPLSQDDQANYNAWAQAIVDPTTQYSPQYWQNRNIQDLINWQHEDMGINR